MSRQDCLDMFAALAMQAWLRIDGETDNKSEDDIAALSYEQADAMMRERDKRAAKSPS